MFGKKNGQDFGGPLLTVMGQAAYLEGKFTITDSIQIECEIAGEINVEGKIVIGEKGIVRADVHTTDAVIKGQYKGNMVATGNVEITASGRVTGNIETNSLVVCKGGFFNGNVAKMNESREGSTGQGASGPVLIEAKKPA